MSDSIICMLLTVFLLNPSQLWARVIRQESFSFIDEMVRYPVSDTFIITAATSGNRGACEDVMGQGTVACRQLVAYFQLGSAELDPKERDQLLAALVECTIAPETGLIVTGHTCSLGTEDRNLILSQQRAEQVTAVLRAHGYTVSKVEAMGSLHPLPGNNQLANNRRVEVATTQP